MILHCQSYKRHRFLLNSVGQLNLEEIYAAYKIGNEGSKKVLIKCGFEFYREKKEFDSLLIREESLIEMIKKDALI